MKITEARLRKVIRQTIVEQISTSASVGNVRTNASVGSPLGKGFVAGYDFVIYDLAYDADGQIVGTTSRELRPDEWLQSDWEEGENIDGVVASLKKLGVTHVGGDEGMMAIEELGLDVPSEDFAPIDAIVRLLKGP